MSNTIVDMPKVCQMLDAGWVAKIDRCDLGTYRVEARHDRISVWIRAKQRTLEQMIESNKNGGLTAAQCKRINDEDFDEPGLIITDDFTPEQALTRMAYKVFGEII